MAKQEFRGGGAAVEFCWQQLLHGGLSRSKGRVGGMDVIPSGGMGPGVLFIGKTDKWHPHLAYAVLWMSLQLYCQYLQMTDHGVGTLMGLIAKALRETLSPTILGRGGGGRLTVKYGKS